MKMVLVPRVAVQLPIEVPLPEGFDHEREETWPDVVGFLEFVGGKLLYMPPAGSRQQGTAVDATAVIAQWRKTHAEFFVGGLEAGMILDGETRAADVAVWRLSQVDPRDPGFHRVAPLLAVEVASQYDTEVQLRDKASWYLGRGVDSVWLLFPADCRVIVLTVEGEQAFGPGEQLPERAATPGLAPFVAELFAQVCA